MEMVFGGEREGCYLYSRHMNLAQDILLKPLLIWKIQMQHMYQHQEWVQLVVP